MKKVSIIIPVFNSEQHIEKCLKNIDATKISIYTCIEDIEDVYPYEAGCVRHIGDIEQEKPRKRADDRADQDKRAHFALRRNRALDHIRRRETAENADDFRRPRHGKVSAHAEDFVNVEDFGVV